MRGDSSWHHVPELCSVYEDAAEYAETLLRVWTLLTFYWGSGAVWPKCRHSQQPGRGGGIAEAEVCGAPLLCTVVVGRACCMRIRTSQGTGTCTRAAAWTCHRSGHDTVCADCLRKSQTALVGRPGVTASTDLYDAQVRKEVTRREGTVFHLAGLHSRKPPFIPPNWNTSYRLQCSVLVALVPVDFAGEPLTRQHPIMWGEIVASDVTEPKLEGSARRNGELTVRLLSRGDCAALRSEADAHLEAGAAVVVVDMRVFVPEVISVLATFAEPSFAQEIAHIPFIGRLIGCEASPALLQVGLGESIDSCVLRAVMGSEIDCVRNLANDVRQAIAQEICRLAPVRSLYGTQLQAFTAALMGSVHCTQGPPGTGKVSHCN
jgi:hypothetical protein